MALNPTITKQLSILNADLSRKSPRTRRYYLSIAKKFLTESGDFSRPGILKFLNNMGYCDNSMRTAYYTLARLCKALEKKFPLDKDDLPPLPDEESIHTPTMTLDNIKRLISYWKNYPGEYVTSLVFMATMFGFRSIEMTDIEIKKDSIIVNVAKRRGKVRREHPIPEGLMKYISGYEQLSEMTVSYAFWKACRRAGIRRRERENWHSIKRCLNTACEDAGIKKVLVKRFLRWARDRRDMSDVYYHKPFDEINAIMFGKIPIPMSDPPKYVVHPFLKLWG